MFTLKTATPKIAAGLIVTLVAITLVAPAGAASKDDCAQDVVTSVRPGMGALLAQQARLLELVELKTAHSLHATDYHYFIALDRGLETIVALDRRIEAIVAVDRDIEAIVVDHWRGTRHVIEDNRERHPMTVGVSLLATFAQIPGQAAITAQQVVRALAKIIPPVFRAAL